VFKAVSFRAAFAAVTAFILCVTLCRPFINWLKSRKINEKLDKTPSDFLKNLRTQKPATPTMGGVIILGATLATMLLWCRLDILFIPLCFFTMLALGLVGLLDDYLKLTDDKRDGLTKKEKLFFQFLVGGGVGLCLTWYGEQPLGTKLAIPFVDPHWWPVLGFFFAGWVALVMTSASNAVNLTDGLDGLATLCVTSVAVTFGLLAYFAGHAGIAEHLAVPRVRGAEELAVW
jgi:phospho-N-acetylmuramoyl-pentapeptide-transferase